MKNKVRRNLKKNNKFNYKKRVMVFVGGRDFKVDGKNDIKGFEDFLLDCGRKMAKIYDYNFAIAKIKNENHTT